MAVPVRRETDVQDSYGFAICGCWDVNGINSYLKLFNKNQEHGFRVHLHLEG